MKNHNITIQLKTFSVIKTKVAEKHKKLIYKNCAILSCDKKTCFSGRQF